MVSKKFIYFSHFPHIPSNGKTSIPLENKSLTLSMCFQTANMKNELIELIRKNVYESFAGVLDIKMPEKEG